MHSVKVYGVSVLVIIIMLLVVVVVVVVRVGIIHVSLSFFSLQKIFPDFSKFKFFFIYHFECNFFISFYHYHYYFVICMHRIRTRLFLQIISLINHSFIHYYHQHKILMVYVVCFLPFFHSFIHSFAREKKRMITNHTITFFFSLRFLI